MPPVERLELKSKCSFPVPMKSSAGKTQVFVPLKVNGAVVATAGSAVATVAPISAPPPSTSAVRTGTAREGVENMKVACGATNVRSRLRNVPLPMLSSSLSVLSDFSIQPMESRVRPPDQPQERELGRKPEAAQS